MTDWYFMNFTRREMSPGGHSDVMRQLMSLITRYRWASTDKVDLVELSPYDLEQLRKEGWRLLGFPYH